MIYFNVQRIQSEVQQIRNAAMQLAQLEQQNAQKLQQITQLCSQISQSLSTMSFPQAQPPQQQVRPFQGAQSFQGVPYQGQPSGYQAGTVTGGMGTQQTVIPSISSLIPPAGKTTSH
jgi:hypothetical protein